jgi:hypothetical protein
VLAERLGVDTHDAGDRDLRNPVAGHGFNLPAVEGIGSVGTTTHQITLTSSGPRVITRRPGLPVSDDEGGSISSGFGS